MKLIIKVHLAWWFWPTFYIYKWTCITTGIEPDFEALYRLVERAIMLKQA